MKLGVSQRLWKGASRAAFLFAVGASCSVSAAADDTAQFYAGKTVRIVVGTSSGGGFDTVSRVLAQYLPAHLPGQPTVVVQNMPGGSSLKAANYIYNVAPPDGTYLGVFNHSLILQSVVDHRSTQFDIEKFNWVGRMAVDDLIGVVWYSSGVKSMEDATKKEVVIGANSGNSSSSMVPRALNRLVGTKFKVVTGYPGLAERYLAMERGEIDGISGASWTYMTETRPDWIAEKKLVPLHQNSTVRSPELPDLPTLVEFARNAEDRKILHLLGLTETIGKSIAFGPAVPAPQVTAMRRAFSATVADKRFSEDAKKRGLIPATMPGEELQALFVDVSASMTDAFVERFKMVIAE
jgi:tripartite-type tricarboxylate transporter receptor subunit TctC